METLIAKLVAILGGMLAGATVHYLSRALGLTETTPGCIFATAVTTTALTFVRWRL